jgi:hypothetical protein
MSITILVSFERAVEKISAYELECTGRLRKQQAYGEKQRLDVRENLRRTKSEPGAS